MEDLTPLYNKEFYLAYLCGEDVVLPIPDGNAERYLAYLCGMDVTIPDVPDGRTETYLAYKCGEDVVLPDPMYRIEFYLAKWCGIDCEVPEPMYRIEYWFAQLANSGELKTVTGNPISVSDALAKPAESLVIEILPQQDLHGYANPWPAGGGKQLINPAQFDELPNANNGVTATDNGDGTISLSGTATANAYLTVIGYKTLSEYGFFEPDTSYTFSAYVKGNVYGIFGIYGSGTDYQDSTGVGRQMTFTAEQLSTLRYRLVIYVANGTNTNGMVVKPMICLSTATDPTVFAPYFNICPISGHDSVKVWVKPTYDPTANPTATIQLGQTVYGGTLDVTTGVLTVDRAMVDLGTLNYSQGFSGFYTTGLKTDVKIPSSVANSGLLSDIFVVGNTASSDQMYIQITGSYAGWIVILPSTSYASASDFKTAMSGHQLCYELATPLTIQLTPTEIQLLLGNNVLWNDVDGDMTLEYLADGPADDVDALNILLGNRYVNNGAEDEATDKEALEILLGGNTR